MVILHIYGAKAIFLLFNDSQDTESESREIGMIISQKNSNIKDTKGYMVQWYTYFTIWEKRLR